jgi:hypothetical protein
VQAIVAEGVSVTAWVEVEVKVALSENLTERPLLRYFLHPLNREEPTLVTAIRLAGDAAEVTGLSEMRREQGYD